jgi:hypothetical protein
MTLQISAKIAIFRGFASKHQHNSSEPFFHLKHKDNSRQSYVCFPKNVRTNFPNCTYVFSKTYVQNFRIVRTKFPQNSPRPERANATIDRATTSTTARNGRTLHRPRDDIHNRPERARVGAMDVSRSEAKRAKTNVIARSGDRATTMGIDDRAKSPQPLRRKLAALAQRILSLCAETRQPLRKESSAFAQKTRTPCAESLPPPLSNAIRLRSISQKDSMSDEEENRLFPKNICKINNQNRSLVVIYVTSRNKRRVA